MNFAPNLETREAGVDWLVLAHALACTHGDPMQAAEAAKHARFSDRVCNILQRAAVGSMSLSDPTSSALGDLRTLTTAFIESLRGASLLDAVLSMCRQIAPRTMVGVVTLGASGSAALEESQWKPISKLSIGSGGTLEPRKVACIVVATEELLRFSAAAQSLFNTEVRGAVVLSQDADAIGELTTGLSALPSAGMPELDFMTLFDAVRITQLSRPILATSPRVVAQLAMYRNGGAVTYPDVALPNGGSIAGVPLLGVDALANDGGSPAGDSLMLLDASQIAGDRGTLTLDTSRHTSLQLDDSPTASSANLVGMFQTDSAALKVERYYALKRLRDDAVAVIEGVDYSEAA